MELVALDQDVRDPARAARFWAELLRRPLVEGDRPLLPATGTQVGLRFSPGPAPSRGPNPVHLHLTSRAPDDQRRTVDRAIALGARPLDVGQRPEETHVVLADPEGQEFCVIAAGNAFLAGCGFLGELTCDGTPRVGRFWAQALGWPLVREEGEQTAVQSPLGGTKISWDGWPQEYPDPDRQRFELRIADGEVDRLVALGARRVTEDTLLDPDGRAFRV